MIVPRSPRETPVLIGHDRIEQIARSAIGSGRCHHAWLLTGPEGVGKATFAYRLARTLLAGFPGPGLSLPVEHPVFRQVAANTYPDLLVVEAPGDGSQIPIDEVRRVALGLSRTSATAGWRVLVIDGVDQLSPNAANAVLKLVEEPPNRTIVMMTTSQPGKVFKTLRSRCIQAAFRPLSEDDLSRAIDLLAGDAAPDAVRVAIRHADGSVGKALTLLSRADLLALDAEDDSVSGAPDAFARLHRQVVGAVQDDRAAKASGDTETQNRLRRWSDLLFLAGAQAKFNLDRGQLAIEFSSDQLA